MKRQPGRKDHWKKDFKNKLFIMTVCAVLVTGFTERPVFAETETISQDVRVAVPTFEGNDVQEVTGWLEDNGFSVWTVTADEVVREEDFDALVIPGGGDIDASIYGQVNDSSNYLINTDFDKFEITLVHLFAGAEKPILGICRGEELINVAFGGTLEQNIPEKHEYYRELRLAPSSFLYGAAGERADAYHNHHQCIDRLGKGLVADTWDAEDGRIEGIHHKSLPIYGVQFHPELDHELNALDDITGSVFMNICLNCMNNP